MAAGIRGKPYGKYEIDPNHPLSRGLIISPAFNEGVGMRVWEPCQRTWLKPPWPMTPTIVGGGVPTWGRAVSTVGFAPYNGREGEPCLVSGQGGGALDLYIDKWGTPPTGQNVAYAGNPRGITYAGVWQPANTTSGTTRLGDTRIGGNTVLYTNITAGKWAATVRNASDVATTTQTPFSVGDWLHVIVSLSDNNALCYCNGVAVTLGDAANCSVAKTWIKVGNMISFGYGVTGDTASNRFSPMQGNISSYQMWYDRALTVAEMSRWYTDGAMCMMRPVVDKRLWAMNSTLLIDRNVPRGVVRGVYTGG